MRAPVPSRELEPWWQIPPQEALPAELSSAQFATISWILGGRVKRMQVASGFRMEEHNDEELVKHTIKHNFFS